MTIIDETDYTAEVEPIGITRGDYGGDYCLHLWFQDGSSHTVDFAPFILNARNPMTTKYRDKVLFQGFTVEYGNLHWNDYEMCFQTSYLYEHKTVEYNGFG